MTPAAGRGILWSTVPEAEHGAIPDELQWARLQRDVNRGLRRGAWYRVIRITDEGVMLDVNRTPVTLPRTLLETVTVPPRRWSVVLRPRDAVCLPRDWGDRYLTCPGCRNRAPTRGHPLTLGCPRCGGVYAVGWDEFDLTAHAALPPALPPPGQTPRQRPVLR